MIRLVKGFLGFLMIGMAPAQTPAWIPMPREVATVEGRFTLPNDCGVKLERPSDGTRLIGMLREQGLNPKLISQRVAIEVKRGAVKKPTGFPGAYQLEV